MFEERIELMNKSANMVLSPTFEKRVYTVDEVMDILEIGKNAAYASQDKFKKVREIEEVEDYVD